MKIRMLVTQKGSPNGIQINLYEVGKVYDLPPKLANVFLRNKWAEEEKTLQAESKEDIKPKRKRR